MATNQVSDVALGEVSRHETGPSSHKRARVSSYADNGRTTYGGGGGVNAAEFLPAWQSSFSRSSGGRGALPPVTELPFIPAATKAAAVAAAAEGSYRGDRKGSRNGYRDPRSASPTPSYASSSTFSAATTTATALSSRASLSSCRSSFTSPAPSHSSHGGSGGGGGAGRRYGSGRASHRSSKGSSFSSRSSYLSSRQAPSATSDGCGGGDGSADFFPKPSSSWSGSRGGSGGGSVNRRRRGSPGGGDRRDGSRDRYVGSSRGREQQHGGSVDVLQPSIASASSRSSRDRRYGYPPSSRRSGGGGRKDYASEAGAGGRKRNRSSSREHGSGSCSSRKSTPESPSGVTCERCLEWCRYSRALQRRPITRTLQMDYYVRTPGCKAAKSKHIDFIDDVAYSREQFIEETVFTCPFTGARRDIVLERNMFPYDVPTDVEHWTLWSRSDLTEAEMEAFVQGWAAENHPHVLEWECDNNEGERSIDWFHVHVFFRVGCPDRTGVPRDPASVYDGPYRRKEEGEDQDEGSREEGTSTTEAEDGQVGAEAGAGGDVSEEDGRSDAEDVGREREEEVEGRSEQEGEEEEAVADHE